MAITLVNLEEIEYAVGPRFLVASALGISGDAPQDTVHSDIFTGTDDLPFTEIDVLYLSGYCSSFTADASKEIDIYLMESDTGEYTGEETDGGNFSVVTTKGPIPIAAIHNPKKFIRVHWLINTGTNVRAFFQSVFLSLEFTLPTPIGVTPPAHLELDANLNPVWVAT